MAEVMKFDDFKEEGTEAACKVRRVPIRNYKLLYKNKGILLLLNYKVKCSLYYLIFTKYCILNFFQAAGKQRQQGKNYVVEYGDIIFFKFNAGSGLKDQRKKK